MSAAEQTAESADLYYSLVVFMNFSPQENSFNYINSSQQIDFCGKSIIKLYKQQQSGFSPDIR